jgi:hydrogenase expression/formation protein HypC
MCLGIPGKILSITEQDGAVHMGRVSFSGIVKEVCLAYTPEAAVGEYVVVHVGFAIATLDEAEARRVFEYLQEMDELRELADAEQPGGAP